MISKWDTVSSSEPINLKIFKAVWHTRRNPNSESESDFITLQSQPWVNIIPITKEGNIVLIKQYRHGVDDITIEIPGGLVENSEKPISAAQRECIEETGYIGDGVAELIGETQPNPAFLDNICYHFVWRNCSKQIKQKLDEHEDIAVFEVPIWEIKKMILIKEIKHSLVLDAFFFYHLKNGKIF